MTATKTSMSSSFVNQIVLVHRLLSGNFIILSEATFWAISQSSPTKLFIKSSFYSLFKKIFLKKELKNDLK